jgi:hypothetical protein
MGGIVSSTAKMIVLAYKKNKPEPLIRPDSTRTPRRSFRGAFYTEGFLDRNEFRCKIDRGFVNGIEPMIGNKKISDEGAVFQYPISFDAYERAYIGVIIKLKPNGAMMATNQASAQNNLIIGLQASIFPPANAHFHPVAIWHKTHGLHQLVYHDLLHISIKQFGKPRSLIFAS